MSNKEAALIAFLEHVLGQNRIESSIRIPKSALLKSLGEYCKDSGQDEDPSLLFEDWEPLLRRSFFIKDHRITYSIFSDTLSVELVPTVAAMNRAAETHSINLKTELVKTVASLSFGDFEQLMEELFRKVPWIESVNVTQRTRDEGIDFEGTYKDHKSGLRMKLYGQAKHMESKVGSEDLRTFIGSISVRSKGSPSIGIFVSSSGYTDDACTAAEKSPIRILIYDADKLADVMIEHSIGVRNFRIEGKTIDEPFWKDIKG